LNEHQNKHQYPNMNPTINTIQAGRKLCGAGALALILSASAAHAAVAITSVANGSAAPVLNSSFGTMELAFNLGNGGALVRDGISFTNSGVTGTSSVVYGTANGITVGSFTTGANTFGNADLGVDALYGTESYTSASAPMTLTLTGLDPMESYLVQVMHGETRSIYTYNAGAITATDSLSNVANGTLTFGPGSSGNRFALVTITVSGTTSLNYFMPTAGRGPSVAGITVQSVPEPSAALLGGLGLLALLRRRR
jgi:MYXO-CTERM domain-containing protein